MTTIGYLFIRGALVLVFCGLTVWSAAQTPTSSSPVASPTAVDPKDPPVGAPPSTNEATKDAASENGDVPDARPDLQLQTEIQDALGKVPELSNDSLRVAALPDGLELTGSVATGREHQSAIRIVQSYARGRKVVDRIVVSGRTPAPPDPSKTTHQANAQP